MFVTKQYLSCTLRSGLHAIPKMIRTFPHGLENNHACKWISEHFPGVLTHVLFAFHLQAWFSSNPCGKVLFLPKSMGQIFPLDLIHLRTCSHGLENNHACKCFSDKFPGIINILAFLENCQKSICMHGCSPINVESS